MKKQHVKNLAKPNKPEGNGLASGSAEAHGLLSCRQSQAQSHYLQAAKEYAFLLLKFRLRSEKELAQRLRQKKFSEAVIQDALSFLKDKQFIDDQVFAEGWVSFRLKRPFGLRRIKNELILKGLDKEIIEAVLATAKEDYSEIEVASQLARQRFFRLKDIEAQKAKARVYAYLIRRGFSSDIVGEIVKGL